MATLVDHTCDKTNWFMDYGAMTDKRRIAFDIVYADVRRDMALIVSGDLAAPAVTFADGDVTVGEKVYAIGNSEGQRCCMLDGIVSDWKRFIFGERYIMYSAPTVGGNSSGPLFQCARRGYRDVYPRSEGRFIDELCHSEAGSQSVSP